MAVTVPFLYNIQTCIWKLNTATGNMFLNKSLTIFLVPVMFLIIGVNTIPDYGINWDEPQHFNRGQAYLHYFLTGKTNYLDLPKHEFLDEGVDFKDIRGNYADIYINSKKSKIDLEKNNSRSYYQSDIFNFEYFKENDSGHPPVNGIVAALFNKIFFQELEITGDLYSYHLFEVFTAFLIVLGVSIFSYYIFGIFPAIIAGASISLYPLFFSESHFNIKDPVLSSFFGLTIIFLYFGLTRKNNLLIILSAITAGLSLGTKFNTLFLPFIVIPWLIVYWWKTQRLKIVPKSFLYLLIYPIIVVGILYLLWPFLWFNGMEGITSILNYYAQEGLGSVELLAKFKFFGFNLYPLTWIILTTPLPILILSILGVFWLSRRVLKNKDHVSLLILLWLFVPILRVTLPNTSIYGGVRHIMEFIPALAISSGAGAKFLLSVVSSRYKNFIAILILLSLIFVFVELVKIHPNENVYFNKLIGGLNGAYSNKIPYAGNSFGNAYQQGIVWLNENAEKNAKLGLPIGGTVNLPRQNLRSDIRVGNDSFSAFLMEGEYEMEMSHIGVPKEYFTYSYLENFLKPVYEVKVEDISILKIWKNDPAYLKKTLPDEININELDLKIEKNVLRIDMNEDIYLTGLYIKHKMDNCKEKTNGSISISQNGMDWTQLSEPTTYPQISNLKIKLTDKDFFFLFAGLNAGNIKINLDDQDSCILNNPTAEVTGFKDSPF